MNKNIVVSHNLQPEKFVWLWSKYVRGFNPNYHCTNSIKGNYSKRLSKHNTQLTWEKDTILDELPNDTFSAVYICGVAKKGYSQKKNYPHNLHTVILPTNNSRDHFQFDGWEITVENGIFLPIPEQADLTPEYLSLPPAYTTCRIFRWAVAYMPTDKQLSTEALKKYLPESM